MKPDQAGWKKKKKKLDTRVCGPCYMTNIMTQKKANVYQSPQESQVQTFNQKGKTWAALLYILPY